MCFHSEHLLHHQDTNYYLYRLGLVFVFVLYDAIIIFKQMVVYLLVLVSLRPFLAVKYCVCVCMCVHVCVCVCVCVHACVCVCLSLPCQCHVQL